MYKTLWSVLCVIGLPDLQACVNAHVLEKGSLCDGSEADHCVSSHFPQITKVNVCSQVCAARSLQHIMQFVSSKTLQKEKSLRICLQGVFGIHQKNVYASLCVADT